MDRSSNDCPSSFLFLSNVCLFVPQVSHTGMDLYRCVSPMFRLFCHASATTGTGNCCTSKRHTISMITSNSYNIFLPRPNWFLAFERISVDFGSPNIFKFPKFQLYAQSCRVLVGAYLTLIINHRSSPIPVQQSKIFKLKKKPRAS